MSTPVTISDETRRAFSLALMDYSGANREKRQAAEIRLNQISRAHRTQLTMDIWESKQKKRIFSNLLVNTFLGLVLLYCVLVPVSYILLSGAALLATNTVTFLIAIFSVSLPFVLMDSQERSITDVLLALDDPKLLPICLEDIAYVSSAPHEKGMAHQRRQALRQKITQLLSEYMLADLPPLTGKHQEILLRELKVFSAIHKVEVRRLREWEVEYVLALLKALQPGDSKALQTTTKEIVGRFAEYPALGVVGANHLPDVAQQVLARF